MLCVHKPGGPVRKYHKLGQCFEGEIRLRALNTNGAAILRMASTLIMRIMRSRTTTHNREWNSLGVSPFAFGMAMVSANSLWPFGG